ENTVFIKAYHLSFNIFGAFALDHAAVADLNVNAHGFKGKADHTDQAAGDFRLVGFIGNTEAVPAVTEAHGDDPARRQVLRRLVLLQQVLRLPVQIGRAHV